MFNLIVVNFICVRFLSHSKMSLSWTFIHFANDLFEVFVTGCIIPALRGPNKTILARDVFGEPLHPVRVRHSSPSRPGESSTFPVSPLTKLGETLEVKHKTKQKGILLNIPLKGLMDVVIVNYYY